MQQLNGHKYEPLGRRDLIRSNYFYIAAPTRSEIMKFNYVLECNGPIEGGELCRRVCSLARVELCLCFLLPTLRPPIVRHPSKHKSQNHNDKLCRSPILDNRKTFSYASTSK